MIIKVTGSLINTWKTWVEFPNPSFTPRTMLHVCGGDGDEPVDAGSLYLFFFFCLSEKKNTERV